MGGGEVVKKGALIKSPPLEGGGGMKVGLVHGYIVALWSLFTNE